MQSSKILENLRKKAIINFTEIFVLGQLKENPLSGYDLIGLFRKRFDIMISPGTIYSTLYSLERDDLIRGIQDGRRRVYEVTEKGEQAIKVIVQTNNEIHNCLSNLVPSQ